MVEQGDRVKLLRDGGERGCFEVVRCGDRWAHAGSGSWIMWRFDKNTGEVIGGGKMVKL